jgi:helix-turn-helix protein
MSGESPFSAALSREEFTRLYRGALGIDDAGRRLQSCFVLLLSGRLGLTPSEIQHLHDAWIDWERGEILVPGFESCNCGSCRATAEERREAGDERSVDAIVEADMWSPSPDSAARTVPFGWSPRTTALLTSLFDQVEYLSLSRSEMTALLKRAAENAGDIDDVSFPILRATAVEFLTDAGFGPRLRVAVTGWEEATRTGSGSDPHVTQSFGETFDRDGSLPDVAVDDPADAFPIACGTSTFDAEPISRPSGDPPGDGGIRPTGPSGEPRNPRYEVEGRSSTGGDGPAPDHDRYRDEPDDEELHADPDEDPSGVVRATEPTETDTEGGGATTSNSVGARATPGKGEEEITVSEEKLEAERRAVAPRTDPSSLLTEPIRTDYSGRFVTTQMDRTEPVKGRILIGQDLLLLTAKPEETEGEGRLTITIPLADIFDVAVDYVPSDFETVVEDAFSAAYKADGGQHIAVVEPITKNRNDGASMLYSAILIGKTVMMTPRARVGGRVTDAQARVMKVQVASSSVRFTDGDTAVTIDHADVAHVESGKRNMGGETLPALLVRYKDDDTPMTVYVGTKSTRVRKILKRYVSLEYNTKKSAVADLSLSDTEKEVLVALYSAGDGIELGTILDQDGDDMVACLDSLRRSGLISNRGGGTKLTEKGRIVVGEQLEDVNA